MARLYKMIIYSGFAAFICLFAAFVWGVGRFDFRVHKKLGIFAFLFGCIHVLLIVYKNMKLRKSK